MDFENISARASEGMKIKGPESLQTTDSLKDPKKTETAINRFVGKEAQSEQPSLEDGFSHSSTTAKLADFEREIPPALEKAIERINTLLIAFLKDWGLEEYVDIDAKKIVLGDIRRDEILREKARTSSGTYHADSTRIRILTPWEMGNYRSFVKTLAHEMIHMQSFQSWQVNFETNRLNQRRQGMRINHGEDSRSYDWLDEAITEELAKRFLNKHEKDIDVLGGVRKPAVILERVNKWHPAGDGHAYKEQRKFLQQIITGIHINGRKKYKNRDEVFRLFTNAALNGRLLPVARAIEKAQGRGSFSKLAELDINLRKKE
jgi:hypothetical protein